MTTKADLTPEDWETVREGPPLAGLTVLSAQRGGTFRETFAMAKAYTEARRQHGASELLDELVGAKPEMDHTRHGSYEELKEHALQRLRDAVAVLERAATPRRSTTTGGSSSRSPRRWPTRTRRAARRSARPSAQRSTRSPAPWARRPDPPGGRETRAAARHGPAAEPAMPVGLQHQAYRRYTESAARHSSGPRTKMRPAWSGPPSRSDSY